MARFLSGGLRADFVIFLYLSFGTHLSTPTFHVPGSAAQLVGWTDFLAELSDLIQGGCSSACCYRWQLFVAVLFNLIHGDCRSACCYRQSVCHSTVASIFAGAACSIQKAGALKAAWMRSTATLRRTASNEGRRPVVREVMLVQTIFCYVVLGTGL